MSTESKHQEGNNANTVLCPVIFEGRKFFGIRECLCCYQKSNFRKNEVHAGIQFSTRTRTFKS